MKLVYMLDTNTVSHALRGEGRVRAEMAKRPPSQLCVSTITLAELRFGAENRKSKKLLRAIEALLAPLRVEPFTVRDALSFGLVASELMRKGKSLDSFDGLIAAHAIALQVTLVTHDRAFQNVPGLDVSDWF